MIREAKDTDADWVEVHDKVQSFNEQYFDVPLYLPGLNKWFYQHLQNGIILLSDTGLITGLYITDPVRNWNVLVETAWYDTGRSGLRLLQEFIKDGQISGMHEVRMTTLSTSPPGVTKILKRMGFEEIEQSHRLKL